MFVRKKKNKSGLQVIDKGSGKYKMLKTIGSSSDASRIDELIEEGKQWIQSYTRQPTLDFRQRPVSVNEFLENIEQVRMEGGTTLTGKDI